MVITISACPCLFFFFFFLSLSHTLDPLFEHVGMVCFSINIVRNKESSVIYLESPAGVGFSYANKSSGYQCNDAKSAHINFLFLQVCFLYFSFYLSTYLSSFPFLPLGHHPDGVHQGLYTHIDMRTHQTCIILDAWLCSICVRVYACDVCNPCPLLFNAAILWSVHFIQK